MFGRAKGKVTLTKKIQHKTETTQRQTLRFQNCMGKPEVWGLFKENQQRIFCFYEGHPSQQLMQLADICDPEKAWSILHYNGKPDRTAKAVEALRLKYGFEHLTVPLMLQKLPPSLQRALRIFREWQS